MSATLPTDDPRPETTVDDDAVRCPYCDRPFPTAHLRTLHLGERHADALDEDERTAYEAASDEETEELFLFHLKVIATIGVMYSIFVVVYMVVLG